MTTTTVTLFHPTWPFHTTTTHLWFGQTTWSPFEFCTITFVTLTPPGNLTSWPWCWPSSHTGLSGHNFLTCVCSCSLLGEQELQPERKLVQIVSLLDFVIINQNYKYHNICKKWKVHELPVEGLSVPMSCFHRFINNHNLLQGMKQELRWTLHYLVLVCWTTCTWWALIHPHLHSLMLICWDLCEQWITSQLISLYIQVDIWEISRYENIFASCHWFYLLLNTVKF